MRSATRLGLGVAAAFFGFIGINLALPLSASAIEPPATTPFILTCVGEPERTLTSASSSDEWTCALSSNGGLRGSDIDRLAFDDQIFELPPDGMVVTSSAIVEAGGEHVEEVSIARAGDEVAIRVGEEPVLGAPAAVAILNANVSHAAPTSPQVDLQAYADHSVKCASVGQVTAYDGRWEGREYAWKHNPTGEPNAGTTTALVSASDSIAGGESAMCGDWPNRAELTYTGRVYWDDPQVLAGGGCGTFSNTNTVGWGALDNSSTLAVACTWRQSSFIVKSDIKFDTSNRSWNTSNSCSGNSFDVSGIATHEFGHAMGLGHVFQESQQVMKPASSPCELDQRALGYGDQRNLVIAYG
ncbi:matrixin family metalloprotease [Cryobacterium luteum]|uniref:Matrixin family metalloprotease n=1 Tax=Cryobacterium luteum TaxID=1424661 RepID=A0A1H8MP06_9MICO|nr:matrixin family metalloprotease [Cryobacterium luteum]TFB84862.1 matrixin family metalloprotease [Cryobacterium luteum]SEO19049.1 Matrixin [Cryobacterium luteum]